MRAIESRRRAAGFRVGSLALGAIVLGGLALPAPAVAGKLSWLDEVVRQAVKEAEAGGKAAIRGSDGAAEATGRLFLREADDSLEAIARRSDDFARLAGRAEAPVAETALRGRFAKAVGADAALVRTFDDLAPAEKRLVVEMGETAGRLARRYPGEAEPMIRRLGVEGMTAVRVYGDDVAEVIAREGPESVNVLRRTGRAGWGFFNETVLPNKGKLAAAGVLGLFLANPEKFVDTAGRATQYAVEQFAKAGIQLAGAVTGGAARGLESALGATLAKYGIDSALTRYLGMGLAALVVLGSLLVLLGLPARLLLRPITWPLRLILGRRTTTTPRAA
jgi:hypothetical protein